jgi:hypothetical protein
MMDRPRVRIDRLGISLPAGWRGEPKALAEALRRELARGGVAAARRWAAQGGHLRIAARPGDTAESLARRMLRALPGNFHPNL